MTKRSLAFIVLMTITFFAMNYFISPKQEKQAPQHESMHQKAIEEDVVSPSALPLRSLKEPNSSRGLMALQLNDVFLVRLNDTKPQELLYNDQNKKLKATADMDIPFGVYSSASSVAIPSFNLADTSDVSLQMVSFDPDDGSVEISLGKYDNKRVFFPQKRPANFALALYREQGNWLLAGIFDVNKNRFYTVNDLSKFSKIADYQDLSNNYADAGLDNSTYYVLENDYQQIVFSDFNAAISEINLPFKSAGNTKSVVRPIRFDREIKEDSSKNAQFPLYSYQTIEEGKQVTKNPLIGGYHPLLRRNLIGPGSRPYSEVSPKYYSLNLLVDGQQKLNNWKVKKLEKNLIEFEHSNANRRIIKTYSLPDKPIAAPYVFDVSIRVEGNVSGLSLTSGVPEVELISGAYSPVLKYRMLRGQKSYIEKIKLPKNTIELSSILPDWVCNSNGFFGIIMDPIAETTSGVSAQYIPGNLDPTRLTLIDPQYHLYPADKYPGYTLSVPVKLGSQPIKFRVYAGPFATEILKRVDATYTDPVTGYNPNYLAAQSFHGWFAFISEPFAKFLFILMQFFYTLTHSWGLSIILLTIALRVMLYPLNTWSIKSNLRMQKVQPKVAAIQEKFKKDPKRMQMEVMQLYRKEKANPFTGCLPILIQMPFLIGMFDLLKSHFDLRGAVFIPGWINNLTAPDVLFSWGYPLPFIGSEFHLLPILLGIVMYFQQKTSMRKQSKSSSDQQKQQKIMGNIFTVVFTVLFYNLPSGLNIYFLSSMALQFLQQWYMSKKMNLNPVRKT